MNLTLAIAAAALALWSLPLPIVQEAPKDCPMMQAQHDHKHASEGVVERGNKAMGFDQNKTTHHFFLKPDGGAIQVTVNDPADSTNLEMIQGHLKHIAAAFAKGDFNIPMVVHDRTPPGVPEMQRRKGKIQYRYETVEKGARVVIQTSDAKALAAVHQFLKFQIQDHATGDSLKVN